jgi:hypothetical protein
MMNIELTSCGLDETLKDIMKDLESAVGNDNSKKRKDEVMYKVLGSVNAIWNMVQVTEPDASAEAESD